VVRQDSKRPDGLKRIPFEGGRVLTWDVTVICSTADTYIDLAVQGPGSVAKLAASHKQVKYMDLQSQYSLQPTAVETLSPVNESACAFLINLGWQILLLTGKNRGACFCFSEFQSLSSASTRFFCTMVLSLSTTHSS